MSFADGYFKLVDRRDAPLNLYEVRGRMEVEIHPDWVVVEVSEEGEPPARHVTPREYVVYVGDWHLDR
jgi:hypothetical protein